MDLRNGGGPQTDWHVSDDKPPATSDNWGQGDQGPSDLVKVVLLGAPGVGKSAIAQQFVKGTFESAYYPTSKKETYYPSVIHHDRSYNLKVVDVPDVPFIPASSFYNLSDLKAYGIRDANAYILVFDLLCPDSFEYVSGMYSQINEGRDLGRVPVVVVGNKTDKVNDNIFKSRFKGRRESDERRDLWGGDSEHGHHGGGHHGFGGHDDHGGGFGGHGSHGGHGGHDDHGFGHFGGGGFGGHGHHDHDHFGSSKKKHKDKKGRHKRDYGMGFGDSSHSSSDKYKHSGSKHKHKNGMDWANTYTPNEYLDQDIADKVTAEWKVMYKECSAKDPEAVTDLFKSVMGVFEEVGVHHFDDEDEKGHDYDRPKPCTILWCVSTQIPPQWIFKFSKNQLTNNMEVEKKYQRQLHLVK